jgi:hypothetical protein
MLNGQGGVSINGQEVHPLQEQVSARVQMMVGGLMIEKAALMVEVESLRARNNDLLNQLNEFLPKPAAKDAPAEDEIG